MARKTYKVVKTVKIDGVEHQANEEVELEPGQAEGLLGTFVEEKTTAAPSPAPSQPSVKGATTPASSPTGAKSGKNTDGL